MFCAVRLRIITPPGSVQHSPAKIKELADLSKTEFKQLEALVARSGWPKSVAREFKASTLALMLDLSACAVRLPGTKPYLDQLIANIARENKIETVGLESMIEQIEILNGLPRETERDLLIAVLRRADRSEDFVETQIARYAEGDIGGLLAWLQSPNLFAVLPRPRSRRRSVTG